MQAFYPCFFCLFLHQNQLLVTLFLCVTFVFFHSDFGRNDITLQGDTALHTLFSLLNNLPQL